MNTKELVAALKEIEPHVEGAIQQDAYLEVRFRDPSNPLITHPITSVEMRFFMAVDEGVPPRATITLG